MSSLGVDVGGSAGAKLRVEYPDLQSFLVDFRENICQGGTFVSSTRPWTVGDRLRVSLTFPGLLIPITLSGRVSFARDGKKPGVGIEFHHHKSEETRASLTRLAKSIEAGDPKIVARLLRVLIVDDNPVICQMIREGFDRRIRRSNSSMVFQFHFCTNGSDALEIIEQKPVDLMIVDFYLPVLDGVTFIKTCRELFGAHLPIIATGDNAPDAPDSARRAGADLYLSKPLRLNKVYHSVLSLLGLEA